jgi:hypothetical protein
MDPGVVSEKKMVMIIAGPGNNNDYAGGTSSDLPGRPTEQMSRHDFQSRETEKRGLIPRDPEPRMTFLASSNSDLLDPGQTHLE